MGMFSYNCRACGHPLLCAQATTKGVNSWMQHGIVIMPNGDVHSGEYDGYGRMGGYDSHGEMDNGSVYHVHCYQALERPLRYVGPSQPAEDQGWFFDEGDHAMASPLDDESVRQSLAPVGEVKVADITLKRRAEAKASRDFYDAERKILSPDCPKCHFESAFIVEKPGEFGLFVGQEPPKVLMVRCPNRQCNHLYPIPAEKQAELRKLFAENPEQHGVYDDDEVNQDLAGVRSLKTEIRHHEKELEKYRGQTGYDDEERAYFAGEVGYHTLEIEKLKAQLVEEERKVRR